jgi:hypothetical protein
MTAEEFFRLRNEGRKLENEYFIAMDKNSFFKLMEDFAIYKNNDGRKKHKDRNLLKRFGTEKAEDIVQPNYP